MKNIAIVCGGYSGEYQISLGSAETVYKHIDRVKYRPYLIFIDKQRWYYKDADGNEYNIDRKDFSLTIAGEHILFDGVFNAIHGTPGEDGKLAAYFDIIGIPYTSCDTDTSALTFNKYHCNLMLHSLGVNVARSFSFLNGDTINRAEVIRELGLPLFVKPARSGSSVGVSKVKTEADFDKAVEKAFETDSRIIIEEFLDGREIACGLYKEGKNLVVLPLTEIISKKEFFDYEAKYSGTLADEITPPENLTPEQETDIKALSAMIYRKLGCKGVIRVDYMLTGTELYLIEINSIPGLSSNSIVPKQAGVMGTTLTDLFSAVIEGMF